METVNSKILENNNSMDQVSALLKKMTVGQLRQGTEKKQAEIKL